jgi:hypothetical protein
MPRASTGLIVVFVAGACAVIAGTVSGDEAQLVGTDASVEAQGIDDDTLLYGGQGQLELQGLGTGAMTLGPHLGTGLKPAPASSPIGGGSWPAISFTALESNQPGLLDEWMSTPSSLLCEQRGYEPRLSI